jgi:PAS domain S-box-containing protein
MKRLTQLGIIPVIAIAIAIATTLLFNVTKPVFEPPYLILVANTIFLTGTSIVVAIISARSYVKGAPSNILLLGCAFLINGLAAVIAGWFFSYSVNYTVTIYNSCTLLSAILQFLNVFLTRQGSNSNANGTKLRIKFALAYLVSISAVGLITAIAYYGVAPKFFQENSGATIIDISVLAISILLFALSSVVLMERDMKSKSHTLFLYYLGLALFAIGLFGVGQETSLGDPIGWIGKIAQYTGGVYFLIMVIMVWKSGQSETSVSERWAETFTTNPEQMTNLFANMTEGFALSKIIYGSKGEPVDYVTLQVNQAWEKLTGIKKENAIGKKITSVIPNLEKDPTDWIGRYGKVASTGESANFEAYAQPLNKWYSVIAYSPRRDYFVTIFHDITERKKAEETLKENEAKLNAAFASMNEAVFIADTEGRLIEFNDEFVRYHRFRNREECSRTINDCPKYLEAFFADGTPAPTERWAMARALRGETATNFEYMLRLKETGEVWWGSYNFGAIRDNSGKVTAAIVTCREITERKKAEEKLEEYQKNLEKLVEERTKQLKDSERLAAIGATAGMVGHDIRNPLQAITSDVYLAKTELASTPESEEKKNTLESLQEIEKNVDYINKIVQDLQDYARPLNPQKEEADVKAIFDKLLAKNGIPKNIKVNVKVEDAIRKIRADPYYLNRIMYNLVTNSVQAMPHGGKLIIQAFKEADDVVITVKDTGVGIPKQIQSKMFTAMFTTKAKGQGFGLPVVKRMTESLGGKVSFESKEGKGTTFTIRLPQSSQQKT